VATSKPHLGLLPPHSTECLDTYVTSAVFPDLNSLEIRLGLIVLNLFIIMSAFHDDCFTLAKYDDKFNKHMLVGITNDFKIYNLKPKIKNLTDR
jgi:hypothetical protein